MSKKLKRFFASALAFVMLLGLTAQPATHAMAEEASVKAYLGYADAGWTYQYWGEDPTTLTNGLVVTNATVTGAGQYTVGLDFTGTATGKAEGLAFSAIMLDQGELVFPGAYITIDSIKVNGEAIECAKTYTSSDDAITTRSNILNEWVTEHPIDARVLSGEVADTTWAAVNKDAFASVEKVEVTFTVSIPFETPLNAYIGYADSSWTYQYWGEDPATITTGVVPTNASVTGPGTYKVGLDFTGTAAGKAEGLAFAAAIMDNAEKLMPGAIVTVDMVEVNGTALTLGKGYANNEGGAIRSNIYNEWVSALPADARRADGDMTDATALMANKDDFAAVETVVVTFSVAYEAQAYIAYVNGDWSVQYWGENPADLTSGIKVTNPVITGAGTYTAAIDFTGTANGYVDGTSFCSLMLKRGELAYKGYVLNIDKIEVNGAEITYGRPYTSSDDGIETRSNLYNEWVTALPDDARTENGDLTDCTWVPLNRDDLNGVETFSVTFTLVAGAATTVATPTPEPVPEITLDKNGVYHAYFGIQTANWTFRNKFDDATYGLGTTEFETLSSVTDGTSVVKQGTLHDVEIKGNGTYTVSLTDFDFADDSETLNLLFASTDIPKSDDIKITDVRVKMDGRTVYKDFTEGYLDPDSKEYINIMCINLWNADLKKGELFAYNMPTQNIEITFTVSGFAYDAEVAEPTVAPTTAPVATPTTAPAAEDTVAPAAEEGGVNVVLIVVIAVVAVAAIGAVVVVALKRKKK